MLLSKLKKFNTNYHEHTSFELFGLIFNFIHYNEGCIEFKFSWKNRTGYLDHFVDDKLAFDEDVCDKDYVHSEEKVLVFFDDYGRRCIGFKTKYGNAVIFDRYIDKSLSVLVGNIDNNIIKEYKKQNNLDYNIFDSNLGRDNIFNKFIEFILQL